MPDINGLELITGSFIALVTFLTWASVEPTQVGGMTGLDSDDLQRINYFELTEEQFGINQTTETLFATCPDLVVTDSQDITRYSNGTIKPDVVDAWFKLELDNASGIYVDANERNIFFEDWIRWQDSDSILLQDSGTIAGENNFLDADKLISSETNRYFNFTFRNVDARIFGIDSECERKATGQETSSGVFETLSNFPIISEISNFFGYILTFFGLIGNLFASLAGLMSIQGNPVSTTMLKIWAGGTLIGMIFVVVDKVIDVINAIGSLIPFT